MNSPACGELRGSIVSNYGSNVSYGTEDIPQLFKETEPSKTRRCCTANELLLSGLCSLGPWSFGCSMGLTSSTVPILEKQGIMTKEEATWYESLLFLGLIIGFVLTAWLVDAVGRKVTMSLGIIPHVTGWLFILFAKSNVKLYYIGRVLQGIAGGVWTIAFVIYMAEAASKHTRGAMSTGFQLGASAGILSTYLFGMILQTRGLAMVATIPLLVMLIGIYFMPDSPRWLMKKNRTSEAISALTWLRETNSEEVEDEFKEIKRNFELHDISLQLNPTCLREEITRIWRPFIIGLSLVVFQQITGLNVIIFNATEIFTVAGFNADGLFGARMQALVFSLVKLISLIPTLFFIDKYGRRPLFFFGALIMGISGLILGFFFAMDQPLKERYSWVAVVFIMTYVSAYDIGMGSIPWIVLGEILPIRVRGVATGIAAILAAIAGFIITKEYQHIIDAISMDGLFWVFGGISFLATIFSCAVMPETRQKSLENIEEKFDSHTENSEFMKEIFNESD